MDDEHDVIDMEDDFDDGDHSMQAPSSRHGGGHAWSIGPRGSHSGSRAPYRPNGSDGSSRFLAADTVVDVGARVSPVDMPALLPSASSSRGASSVSSTATCRRGTDDDEDDQPGLRRANEEGSSSASVRSTAGEQHVALTWRRPRGNGHVLDEAHDERPFQTSTWEGRLGSSMPTRRHVARRREDRSPDSPFRRERMLRAAERRTAQLIVGNIEQRLHDARGRTEGDGARAGVNPGRIVRMSPSSTSTSSSRGRGFIGSGGVTRSAPMFRSRAAPSVMSRISEIMSDDGSTTTKTTCSNVVMTTSVVEAAPLSTRTHS